MNYLANLLQASWTNVFWLWMIPLLLAIILLLALKGKQRWLPAFLRFLVISLVFLALASPVLKNSGSSKQLTALLDVSYSTSEKGIESFAELLKPLWQDQPELKIKVYPFAKNLSRNAVSLDGPDDLSKLKSLAEGEVNSGGTNIAAALNKISKISKSESVLLLSDGQENSGDAKKAAARLAAKGLQLHTLIPNSEAFTKERLALSSLDAPITARSAEKVFIRTAVKNSFKSPKDSQLELWLDGKKLSESTLRIPAGEERVLRLESPELEGGLKRIRAVLKSEGEVIDEAHRWISIKERSRILLISGAIDDETVIKDVFSIHGFTIENIVANGRKKIPNDLSKFSSIVLNNTAKRQLPSKFLTKLKQFVETGGGLVLIGGERSFGLGGYINTPLEEISPLAFVPPHTKKKRLVNAVALVLDKSRSMYSSGKIESAKQAALSAINSLKNDDMVTVIGFDSTPFVIIRLKKVAEVKPTAQRRMRNLTAAGRTDLLPALAAARQALENSGAGRRHIVVLSDGKFPGAGGVTKEVVRIKNSGITISAVALGNEADIPFMREMASTGKGAFYHTLDARRLPQIFLKDIKVAVGEETMKEQKDFRISEGPAGLQSARVGGFPILRGFVETKPKKGSKLELITAKQNKPYPILASWGRGKGRVAAFTSDANGRWSNPWLRWEKFSAFWSQILESVKPRKGEKAKDVEYDLRYSIEGSKLVLDLALFDPELVNRSAPQISATVSEPGGEKTDVNFKGIKKGRFITEIKNAKPGDYKVNISYGELKLPAAGITIRGDSFGEKRGLGLNISLLSSLAHLGGGKINPAVGSLSASERVSEDNKLLFIPLIIAAFILLLLEAFVRELGVFSFISNLFVNKKPENSSNKRAKRTKAA